MALIASVMLAPVALRVTLLTGMEIRPGAADLRGLLSDTAIVLFVVAAVVMLARWKRWTGAALVGSWSLISYGNYEHVRALGGNASWHNAAYLTDPTFLEGSALSLSAPWLLLGLLPASVGVAWWALGAAIRLHPRRLIAIGLVVVVLHSVWPMIPTALTWRQNHFLWENVRWSFAPPLGEQAFTPPPGPGDLDGEPLVTLGHPNQNVLLILLEGLSGGHVAPIAAANGRSTDYRLTHLSRLVEENVAYATFVTLQRQTNRGEYAILCGDYPKLVTAEPKMSALIGGGARHCLPAALAAEGYQTVYLQAAPLNFMMKDQFMPLIGFERVIGDSFFKSAYSRNKWGVDDRTFFEQSLSIVEELKSTGRPWFLTLLTVGTHHPFNVPASHPGDLNQPMRRAFEYQDAAVGAFLDSLRASGVLENTLVILASDESAGLEGPDEDVSRRLGQHWGFLLAMLPSGDRLLVDEPYLQIDLALSILDYLSLRDQAKRFAGRSVFRRYVEPRPFAFGNIYLRSVGGMDRKGRLVLCLEDLSSCIDRQLGDQRLFRNLPIPSVMSPTSDADFLRRLIARSLITAPPPEEDRPPPMPGDVRGDRTIRLIADPVFVVRDDVDDLQWVFGGQYLTLDAGRRLEIEVDVAVRGNEGRLKLQHGLTTEDARKETLFRKAVPGMKDGDRFYARYDYTADRRLQRIDVYLVVTLQGGGKMSLDVRKATMRIAPIGSRRAGPASGLQIHQLDITIDGRTYRTTGSP